MVNLDTERRERPEKHGVVFAIIRKGKLRLERRTELGKPFYGYIIIPGEKLKEPKEGEEAETLEDTLRRGVREECGVEVLKYRKLGFVGSEENGVLNFRHVYRIDELKGRVRNFEGRNLQIEASLPVARLICQHPVSQRILDLIEEDLSRQHK